jgi:hypothetical protein
VRTQLLKQYANSKYVNVKSVNTESRMEFKYKIKYVVVAVVALAAAGGRL